MVLVQLDRSLKAPKERAIRGVKLQPAVLIVPDRNHTQAVSLVAAVENISTSQHTSVILTTTISHCSLAASFWWEFRGPEQMSEVTVDQPRPQALV